MLCSFLGPARFPPTEGEIRGAALAHREGGPVRAGRAGDDNFVFAVRDERATIRLCPRSAPHVEGAELRLEIMFFHIQRAATARAPRDDPVHIRHHPLTRALRSGIRVDDFTLLML